MINQYKLRDINKNDSLHKQVFVLRDDCMEMLQLFVEAAVASGADEQGIMDYVDSKIEASH